MTAIVLHVHAGVLVDFIPDEGRRKQLLTNVAAHFEQEGNVEVAMELERAAGQLEKALDLTNRQLSNALEQMDLRGDAASGAPGGFCDPGCQWLCIIKLSGLMYYCVVAWGCWSCVVACLHVLWPSGAEALWSCLGIWSGECAWAGATVVEQQGAQNAASWRLTYASALWTVWSCLMLAVHGCLPAHVVVAI